MKAPTKGLASKIVVCEDTKGTGRADKVTVFAEGLSIPTSICFANGGIIVFDATQTVFLKDTKGDGKADLRQVLFGTWNQRDTHGGPSNMQYGLDNWIWGMQGYNDSRLMVGGEEVRFRMGFFRFKPDASKMEFIRSTNNNTWGFGMSEEGLIFGSTLANGNPSEYMPIPNRYYESVRGWAPQLVLCAHCRLVHVQGDHGARSPGRFSRRLHGRGRSCTLHRAHVSEGVLEPHRLRGRADRTPRWGRSSCGFGREQLQIVEPVQPDGERR